MSIIRLGVLAVSDAAAADEAPDGAGRAIIEAAEQRGWRVVAYHVSPCESESIHASIMEMVDVDEADLVLTVGGVGLRETDIVPECTRSVCDRRLPGPAELIRATELAADPGAILFRGESAMRDGTVVVNLPAGDGSLMRAFAAVAPGLERVLDLRGGALGEAAGA